MRIDDLSAAEQSALPRALKYWTTHWDWECPTLFGLDKNEFETIASTWPACLMERETNAALALVGAMRELLHGASAVQDRQVQQLIGISHAEATALLDRLLPRIDRVLKNVV
jgi:hypothetical protein